MALQIEVETADNRLEFHLFAVSEITSRQPIPITGIGTVTPLWSRAQKALGANEVFVWLLEIERDVSVGVAAAWLYDQLKGRATRLVIDRTLVELEEGEICRVIKEHIETEK